MPARAPASATGTAVLPVQGAPHHGPPPSVIPTAMLPGAPRSTTTTTLSDNAAERLERTEAGRSAPRWPLLAGAAAVLVLGTAGVALLRSHPAPAPTAPAAETVAAPASAAATPRVATPPPPAPRMVTVEVDDAPSGLTLTLDGAAADLPARLPAGDQVHELTFRAPGHRARTLRLDGSQSRHVTLALEPDAPATTPEPAKATPPRDRRKRTPAARPAEHELTEDARKL
jgi:hypothetical protein